jgi:hypothetical protein
VPSGPVTVTGGESSVATQSHAATTHGPGKQGKQVTSTAEVARRPGYRGPDRRTPVEGIGTSSRAAALATAVGTGILGGLGGLAVAAHLSGLELAMGGPLPRGAAGGSSPRSSPATSR